jgi:hypothetical protein
MEDLVRKARRYATEAHSRINHRRKYSLEPYDVHLKDVAGIVASVTDDQEMLAAAWLHDVVEDTPASFLDIELEFGHALAELVGELTDVSRPSDGNRATRKAIDRARLAGVSSRAKTVKLADLIDNCRDVCGHDPEFARVYLTEMAALLEVLTDGDQDLYNRAATMLDKNAARLGLSLKVVSAPPRPMPPAFPGLASLSRISGLFQNAFSAGDIARPLRSVDSPLTDGAAGLMERECLPVLGVRHDGAVAGFALREAPLLTRDFRPGQIVSDGAGLAEVIHSLSRHSLCFVRAFGDVAGVITRDDLEHPFMRMWLFGIVTMFEMQLASFVERNWPDDGWRSLVSAGRLAKAEAMLDERRRRGQQSSLLSCLQFSDKIQIMVEDGPMLEALGFPSRSVAHKVCKEFESLRNNLAHAQSIAAHDFAQIARLAGRIESLREFEDARIPG